MKISETIQNIVNESESKALGTVGGSGVMNVVPISMVKAEADAIYIFNFFMRKTLENILENKAVAFSAWSGMTGVQIKGTTEYLTKGSEFTKMVDWVASENPARMVLGVIKITPHELFDVSPGKNIPTDDLALS